MHSENNWKYYVRYRFMNRNRIHLQWAKFNVFHLLVFFSMFLSVFVALSAYFRTLETLTHTSMRRPYSGIWICCFQTNCIFLCFPIFSFFWLFLHLSLAQKVKKKTTEKIQAFQFMKENHLMTMYELNEIKTKQKTHHQHSTDTHTQTFLHI